VPHGTSDWHRSPPAPRSTGYVEYESRPPTFSLLRAIWGGEPFSIIGRLGQVPSRVSEPSTAARPKVHTGRRDRPLNGVIPYVAGVLARDEAIVAIAPRRPSDAATDDRTTDLPSTTGAGLC
jgi:hypothetical protein